LDVRDLDAGICIQCANVPCVYAGELTAMEIQLLHGMFWGNPSVG